MISIQIDARGAINMLNGLSASVPKALDNGMKKLSERAIASLQESARVARIKHWGGGVEPSLFSGRGVFARKTNEGYNIYMVRHGIQLDSMPNHWVALKRGRAIRQWAYDRGIAVAQGRGKNPLVTLYPFKTGSVFVRKHPFIQRGFRWTVSKAKPTVEKEINKAIRRRGR